jgi:hypothetical protein
VAGLAVDADANLTANVSSCSSTAPGDYYPWWAVDLVDQTFVYGVKLKNGYQYGRCINIASVGIKLKIRVATSSFQLTWHCILTLSVSAYVCLSVANQQ